MDLRLRRAGVSVLGSRGASRDCRAALNVAVCGLKVKWRGVNNSLTVGPLNRGGCRRLIRSD